MRKITIQTTIILSLLLILSCTNNGKKVATDNAKKVEKVTTNKTQTYANFKDSSHLNWRASHLGGVQPRFGKIGLKSVKFSVNNNKLSNATVLIDMNSLIVESFPKGSDQIAKLVGHLKSDDFFKIEKYPTSKFEITNVVETSGEYNAKVTGNLTILETTKSISFNANIKVSDAEVSLQSEDFSINRTDWKLTYNTEGTVGVPKDYIIANNIGFTINIIATR